MKQNTNTQKPTNKNWKNHGWHGSDWLEKGYLVET